MKSKYEGRVTRTSGWHHQPEFDNLISDLDISSLAFLNDKYKNDIKDFPKQFDLNDPKHQKFYQEILQRKKMIREEINHRTMDSYASESFSGGGEFFDSNTGLVIDNYGDVRYSIAFTEDEDDMVYDHTDNSANFPSESEDDETDYATYIPLDRKEGRKIIYGNWNYQDSLNEEEE